MKKDSVEKDQLAIMPMDKINSEGFLISGKLDCVLLLKKENVESSVVSVSMLMEKVN